MRPPTGTLPAQSDEQKRQALLRQAKPFWLTMLGLLTASLLVLLLLSPAPAIPTPTQPPPASQRLVYLSLALGCLCTGALIGFLFGIPNTDQSKRDLTLKAPAATGGALPTDQPSTNLEQVSDWLTKIIIGVSLVEASRLRNALGSLGAMVQAASGGSVIVPQLIVVTFGILGFACAYIWTRLYYGSLQMILDSNLRQYLSSVAALLTQAVDKSTRAEEKADTLGQQQQQQDTALSTQRAVLNEMIANKNTSSAVPAAPEATPHADLLAMRSEASTAEAPWQTKLARFMAAPVEENADPTAEIFGCPPAALNDRRLSVALIATLAEGLYYLKAQVVGSVERPLQGKVLLLLHPTYIERAVEVLVDQRSPGGSAAYGFSARGSFTLIAIADEGATVLGYDLSTLPGVPPGW